MKIIFAGTPDFAVPSLQMLLTSGHEVCAVYTQPDRPAGRGRHLQPSPVKQLAVTADIPVLQPLNFKADADLQQLRRFNADLMVVVAYGIILPQTVLDAPKWGCLNVHGSLLPRWRGAAPIQRAVMAGDGETGVTIIKLVLKLDAGDMLHKEVCTISGADTSSDLHDRLAALGAVGLGKVLAQLEQGTVHAEPQDEALITYAEKLDKSEALIDWTQAATAIACKVRGLNAWPVAQTLYRGEMLRIWRAEALEDNTGTALPGAVVCAHKQLDIMTGNGKLRLLEVQLPGGKRMAVEAFLNAHDLNGVILG